MHTNEDEWELWTGVQPSSSHEAVQIPVLLFISTFFGAALVMTNDQDSETD